MRTSLGLDYNPSFPHDINCGVITKFYSISKSLIQIRKADLSPHIYMIAATGI